jgi:hypothetical protein
MSCKQPAFLAPLPEIKKREGQEVRNSAEQTTSKHDGSDKGKCRNAQKGLQHFLSLEGHDRCRRLTRSTRRNRMRFLFYGAA